MLVLKLLDAVTVVKGKQITENNNQNDLNIDNYEKLF